MAANESIDWDLGKAPKQSITEVLQDPRGPLIELPDISTIDLSTTALTLTPVTPTNLPPPLNINHFEAYLRRFASTRNSVLRNAPDKPATHAESAPVPSIFFDDAFDVAAYPLLADLQQAQHEPLSLNPQLATLQESLGFHQNALERQLTTVLHAQSHQIETALQNMTMLRKRLVDTAAALRATREKAASLNPHVTAPISATAALTLARQNIHHLLQAARLLRETVAAPSAVAVLLDAGAYAAAIARVLDARASLASPHLAGVQGLFPVRHRLANAIESIDAALRVEFRTALHDADHNALQEVVVLVTRIGRLALLRRFFMNEIRDSLAAQLADVSSLPAVTRVVNTCASRAVMLSGIVHADAGDSAASHQESGILSDKKDAPSLTSERASLRDILSEFEELIANFVENSWKSFEPTEQIITDKPMFIILTKESNLSEETCFDEFKAALKFGEEIRALEQLATNLETMFDVGKKRSALRAKIAQKKIAFITTFHRTHLDEISKSVRADKWQEMDISKGAIRLVSAVVQKCFDSTYNETSASTAGPVMKGKEQEDVKPRRQGKGGVDSVFIIDRAMFRTVACGVRYVRSVCTYALLAEQSVTLGAEIARRGTELSRSFNTLVFKAILGVAALQWSGLRSITARHLSLASRTIALASRVTTDVHQKLETALQGKSQMSVVTPLMRKCEKDLRDHHGQLLGKIVDVMMDRLKAHEEALKSLPWEKQVEMQRFDIPSSYIVTLAKETSVLHRILWYVLPRLEAIDIFKTVWKAYGARLFDAYGSLDGGKKWIRERVAKDVASLYDAFRALELSKVSADALKPIGDLYKSFAKEVVEASVLKSEDREDKELVPKTTRDTSKEKAAVLKSEDKKEKEGLEPNKVTSSAHDAGKEAAPSSHGASTEATVTSSNSDGSQEASPSLPLKEGQTAVAQASMELKNEDSSAQSSVDVDSRDKTNESKDESP